MEFGHKYLSYQILLANFTKYFGNISNSPMSLNTDASTRNVRNFYDCTVSCNDIIILLYKYCILNITLQCLKCNIYLSFFLYNISKISFHTIFWQLFILIYFFFGKWMIYVFENCAFKMSIKENIILLSIPSHLDFYVNCQTWI